MLAKTHQLRKPQSLHCCRFLAPSNPSDAFVWRLMHNITKPQHRRVLVVLAVPCRAAPRRASPPEASPHSEQIAELLRQDTTPLRFIRRAEFHESLRVIIGSFLVSDHAFPMCLFSASSFDSSISRAVSAQQSDDRSPSSSPEHMLWLRRLGVGRVG